MEIEVFLIVLVFSKWLLTTDALLQNSSLAGTPLSEAEYASFFRSLATRHAFHAICLRRTRLGCSDPSIQALDRYENHNVIPDGRICSDLPDHTTYPRFCDFALDRCRMKKYFAKRVLCPDETTQKSTVTQTNQEAIHIDYFDHIVISTPERSFELPDSTTTTSTESSPKPLANSAIDLASKFASQLYAAFKDATKPSSKSATSETFRELTSTRVASATPETFSSFTTPKTEEFLIVLRKTAAVIMEPQMNKTTEATNATQATVKPPTESFPEPTTATPKASSKFTTPMAEEFSTGLTRNAATIAEPELNKATTATIAAPTQATVKAPTKSFSELATATPEASSMLITPMAKEFSNEFTRTSAVSMEPVVNKATTATTAAPRQETFTAPTESFPELATATPEASPKLTTPMAEEFSTESPWNTAVNMGPELKKATTATTAAPTESIPAITTTNSPPQNFVPSFGASLPRPPLHSNITMNILILSFIESKNVKSGDKAGTSPLSQAKLGSSNTLSQEEIQNPLPTNGLKAVSHQLHNKDVQQLGVKRQKGISRGEQKSSGASVDDA